MNHIVNYAIKPEVSHVFEPFPSMHLARFRWLTRPLNWLLNRLGAFHACKAVHYSVMQLDTGKLREFVARQHYEFGRRGGELKTLVIGRSQYADLLRGAEPHDIMRLNNVCGGDVMRLKVETFMGVSIVLHPFIDGIVPLDF